MHNTNVRGLTNGLNCDWLLRFSDEFEQIKELGSNYGWGGLAVTRDGHVLVRTHLPVDFSHFDCPLSTRPRCVWLADDVSWCRFCFRAGQPQ